MAGEGVDLTVPLPRGRGAEAVEEYKRWTVGILRLPAMDGGLSSIDLVDLFCQASRSEAPPDHPVCEGDQADPRRHDLLLPFPDYREREREGSLRGAGSRQRWGEIGL